MTIKILAWPKNRNKKENPYNAQLYKFMSPKVEVDEFNYRKFDVKGAEILHVHWPDRLLDDRKRWRLWWRFSRFLKAIDSLREVGGKLIWTVHNLQSREIQHQALAEVYLERFIKKVDGLIFLTDRSRTLFFETYPYAVGTTSSVIPHMHYSNIYGQINNGAPQSFLLPKPKKLVLGFFGKIRSNKGLEDLVKSAAKLENDEVHLLLTGNPGKRQVPSLVEQYLTNADKGTGIFRYINEVEVPAIFSYCDAMIFPYKDILNSGSAILSLSLNRPLIAPDMGSFPELQSIVGDDWVYLYQQPMSKNNLADAIVWLKNRSANLNKPDLSTMEPATISELTENFYRQMLAAPR